MIVMGYRQMTDEMMETLERMWITKWPIGKKRRQALMAAHAEVVMARTRLKLMATELSEWRLKVGGAFYKQDGPVFKEMVEQGLYNILGTRPIAISDDDLKG